MLKGLDAAIECVGGAALAITDNGVIKQWVMRLILNELSHDRQDYVANHLIAVAQAFSIQTQHFYAWYLLSHGVVKLVLVAGLLRRKLWSYPTAMVVFGLFIAYQLYRYTLNPGVGLLMLTGLDLAVVVLTWHEYRLMRRHLPLV